MFIIMLLIDLLEKNLQEVRPEFLQVFFKIESSE